MNWKCPECSGVKRAPSAPRKNDVRRFCLPCSERTGFLVERVSVARESKKAREARQAEVRKSLAVLRAAMGGTSRYVTGDYAREEMMVVLRAARDHDVRLMGYGSLVGMTDAELEAICRDGEEAHHAGV